MCPEGGSPPSFLVLDFFQIYFTILTGWFFLLMLFHVIHQYLRPGDRPKRRLDLLMLVLFLICAFGACWVIVGVAFPWGSALDNWYFHAHNALANSVPDSCSLNSFIAINDAMNGAYGQASLIQSTLIRVALIVGIGSFAVLALYGRVIRGSWYGWLRQYFTTSRPGVQHQRS